MQPLIQSPLKFFSANSRPTPPPLPPPNAIPPLIVHKIIPTIPTNTPFFYTSALSHFPFLGTAILTGIFPTSAKWT